MKTFTSGLQANLMLSLKDALRQGCKCPQEGGGDAHNPLENLWVLGGLRALIFKPAQE